MFVDVLLVLDQLVLELLFQVDARGTDLRQAIDDVGDEVETVHRFLTVLYARLMVLATASSNGRGGGASEFDEFIDRISHIRFIG